MDLGSQCWAASFIHSCWAQAGVTVIVVSRKVFYMSLYMCSTQRGGGLWWSRRWKIELGESKREQELQSFVVSSENGFLLVVVHVKSCCTQGGGSWWWQRWKIGWCWSRQYQESKSFVVSRNDYYTRITMITWVEWMSIMMEMNMIMKLWGGQI